MEPWYKASGGQVDKVAHLPELRFVLCEPGVDTTSIDNAAVALEAKVFLSENFIDTSVMIAYMRGIENDAGNV